MGLEYVVNQIRDQEIVDGDVVIVGYRRLTNSGKDSKIGVLFGFYEVNKKANGGFTIYPDLKSLGLGNLRCLRSFCVTFYENGSSAYTALDIVKVMGYSELKDFARNMIP